MQRPGHPKSRPEPPTARASTDSQPARGERSTPWIQEPAPTTQAEVLQALTKVTHDLLQASVTQPNEDVTILAYRACNYIAVLNSGGAPPHALPQREQPNEPDIVIDPTTTIFALDNPIIEVEATLDHMMQNHGDMPRRHLYKELARLEQMLKDAKHVLTAWGKDPNAPGAHEGVAGVRNALDALDWLHLAIEEGNVAQIGETITVALQAVQRTRGYMETLIHWLRSKFQDTSGSPAKKRKAIERASGSQQTPILVAQTPQPAQRDPPALPHDARERARQEPVFVDRGPQPAQRDLPALPREARERARHEQGQRGEGEQHPRLQQHNQQAGEATPLMILQAREILKKIMPFAEQEMALHLNEAYGLLEQWTVGLWGHPIQLVDSLESNRDDQQARPEGPGGSCPGTLPEYSGDETPLSQAETVPVELGPTNEEHRGRSPSRGTRPRRAKRPASHRRRRLQAALASTSSEASESE